MYKNILIATDGSEVSQKAVGQGLGLARALGAAVTVVTVTEPWSGLATSEMTIAFPIEEYEKSAEATASKILAGVVEVARKTGISCNTIHLKNKYPADGIIETAGSIGADLIVMASHGRRGVSRLLIGSQANSVVVMSKIPVLICR